MDPKPPTYTSSKSVSRSTTSRDEVRLMAEEMLRASLTRSSHGSTSTSVTSSTATSPPARSLDSELPPSYRRSTPALPSSSRSPIAPNPADLLSRARNPGAGRPPVVGSESITRDSLTRDKASRSVTSDAGSSWSSWTSSSSSSTATVTAADAKARVRHLQREVEKAQADVSPRSERTGSLFREACSTDLLFLIDTTGSMYSYIKAAKEQVQSIVSDIKATFLNEAEVRVAVVSYKDHGDYPNIEFLDFTPSAERVSEFLGRLDADGGRDTPEDVLGGVNQALNASWKQQTRCIIHIADAPPHGAGVLHDLGSSSDDYPSPGSEPHHLTYEPLIKKLIQLKVNYALLRVNALTDRMALAFGKVYSASGAGVKLLSSNTYCSQVKDGLGSTTLGASTLQADLQFEEMELGITYSHLRHLVVKTVSTSVTRTAGRMSLALGTTPKLSVASGKGKSRGMATDLSSIREDGSSGGSIKEPSLEKGPPQWNRPGWLDETLVVEGFCPDMVLQTANSLNEMMHSDDNIKLSVTQLTIHARSKPFAAGSVRLASYARTSASTSKFVVKSFKDGSKMLAHIAEDMRIQALCKSFALEFNGLLNIEPPIDFIVTTCLQSKAKDGEEADCLSLEPYIDGEYVKYNSNSMFVKEDLPGEPDTFNQIAQAFSHFTFERSWGHFLVNDLQGVGHLLTDPSIQTRDPERFNLAVTNLGDAGFKFFFAVHECNSFCHKLELKSNREMLATGTFEFRERWPTIEPTVCCSNKLCRSIIRLADSQESTNFPGHHWCGACWPQLQSSTTRWICSAPGPDHEFEVSKFFYESQGQLTPRRCAEHTERDRSVSSAAAVGGSVWGRLKAGGPKRSISGRAW
ncbi:elongation factor-2 kinase EFK-1B isoform [Rhexocercosporidium sp. MPI-PUGE-AT-0058]|nr:elongation factor-2 kinase EFK-1B isoform [Rhexocercosporidium sp. MPI-PUGE-AT-0058]